MLKKILTTFFSVIALSVIIVACNNSNSSASTDTTKDSTKSYMGYDSQVKYGEHLVTIGGCGDCHTPKKMTPQGPVPDDALTLSGHPAQMPIPDVDRKMAETKGLAVTNTLSSWVGPWGVSYAANLTPDSTGIGSWKEEQFIYAIRNGKHKGLADARPILPPMPWQTVAQMTDNELKSVFAYLKSIKPIHNVVPEAQTPLTAAR